MKLYVYKEGYDAMINSQIEAGATKEEAEKMFAQLLNVAGKQIYDAHHADQAKAMLNGELPVD